MTNFPSNLHNLEVPTGLFPISEIHSDPEESNTANSYVRSQEIKVQVYNNIANKESEVIKEEIVQ